MEKVILACAFERMTKEDLSALEESIERAERRLARGESPTKENLEFHLILSRATRNEMFHILIESVMKVVSQFLIKLNPTQSESRKVLEDHRILLRLIKRRNRRHCVTRMGKHLIEIEKRLSSLMKKKMFRAHGNNKAYLINL